MINRTKLKSYNENWDQCIIKYLKQTNSKNNKTVYLKGYRMRVGMLQNFNFYQ